ncbi:MAG TPA: HAD family acid phosphatase [Opitutaceae bacterium]
MLLRLLRFVPAPGLLALTLGFAGCTTAPREPLNLSTAKQAVVRYVESGGYERDLAAVAARASAWLEERAGRRGPNERLAVVFDIDETVLSSYAHMETMDFGYEVEAWHAWIARAEGTAIKPVREVYHTARRLGIDVIFLTGRKDARDRAGTEANLRREGMGEYARLIMAPADGQQLTAAQRKAAARAALGFEGHTIVASIGDQQSDLEGGHAERTFKLPNPFYLVP